MIGVTFPDIARGIAHGATQRHVADTLEAVEPRFSGRANSDSRGGGGLRGVRYFDRASKIGGNERYRSIADPLIHNAQSAATTLTKPCSRSAAANSPTMLNKRGGQHLLSPQLLEMTLAT